MTFAQSRRKKTPLILVSFMKLLAPLLLPCLTLSLLVSAADSWTEFRGPTRDGHTDAKGLPLTWSESKNVRWKTAIHGRAWSTPVILGDQIWMTTATPNGTEMFAVCVDRNTGKILHDRRLFEVAKPRPLGNTVNSYGSPSGVIEPGRVYLTFGSYGTACLDTTIGKTLWERRDLPCNHFRGPASSLVMFENLLIMHMDGSDHHYVVALDKKTGKTVWKTPRSTDYGDLDAQGHPRAKGDFRKAYNTPIIVPVGGKLQLISPGAKAAYGYDPRTGKEIWTVRYPQHSTASRTVFHDGVAFINTGYAKAQLWAVKADGRGDVTDTHVLWKLKRNVPNRSSPVLVDGRIFMCNDKGIASSIDVKTGEAVWRERIDGNYSASALFAEGRVYFFDEEGTTTVIRAAPKFEVLARNKLDDGLMASPAVAGKSLFLRTRTHLYRIDDTGDTGDTGDTDGTDGTKD